MQVCIYIGDLLMYAPVKFEDQVLNIHSFFIGNFFIYIYRTLTLFASISETRECVVVIVAAAIVPTYTRSFSCFNGDASG